MKILFICKYNAFRSRVAEEYFRKINKNKRIKAISRGIIASGNSDSIQRGMAKMLFGINISKRAPKTVNIQELKQANKIIVVANDVPKIIFNYRKNSLLDKVIIWRIKDEQYMNAKNIKRIILGIRKRVDELNRRLQ